MRTLRSVPKKNGDADPTRQGGSSKQEGASGRSIRFPGAVVFKERPPSRLEANTAMPTQATTGYLNRPTRAFPAASADAKALRIEPLSQAEVRELSDERLEYVVSLFPHHAEKLSRCVPPRGTDSDRTLPYTIKHLEQSAEYAAAELLRRRGAAAAE